MSHPSALKTPGGEATYLAAYDAAMTLWRQNDQVAEAQCLTL
jgi:hypothetical protein